MADAFEQGYTRLLNFGQDEALTQGPFELSSGGGGGMIGSASSDMVVNPITGEVTSSNIQGGDFVDGLVFGREAFIRAGADGYDDGTGFFLGWDETVHKFFIGADDGNKLTWDGTTLSITGTITVTAGTIAGLTISATSLTATSGGNTTIVSSGSTAFTAGPTGSPTFTVTQAGLLTTISALIGGWNVVDGYIYNLQSGTPTATPNDGLVFASGNEGILVYEDTAERVRLGYLSAGVYGLKIWDTLGTTVIAEISDAQQYLSGFTLAATDIAVSTNIIMDASAKAISINSATYGTDGIQFQYNAGNPRMYVGDGANQFFQFDGTNISWDGANSSLSTAGKLTTISAAIGGWEVVSGYIYNLQSGTPISSPSDGIVFASGNEAVIIYEGTAERVRNGYLSAGVYGTRVFATDGTTVIFEASDTRQVIGGWNFTNLVIRTGSTDANSNVLIDSANSLLRLGPTTGNYITADGANLRIRSSNYSTGVSGFTVEPTLIEAENLVARGIMRGSVFQYDIISAVGGQVMVANSDVLSADMTALDASTLTVRGLGATFAANDILVMRATTASGIQEEWLRVTSAASAPTYTVTRDLAGSFAADSNPVWQAGTPVVKQGTSDGAAAYSGGWLRLFGEGTNSPYYSVFERTGVAYNAYTERMRMGNLNGFLGYVADTFGFGVGSSAGTNANITIDPTNGIRIRNGTTNVITLDNSGNVTVNTITATAGTIAAFTIASTTISATNLTLTSGAANTANITVGTGANAGGINSANAAGDIIFWGGATHANRATAAFRVEADGDVTGTTVTITGGTLTYPSDHLFFSTDTFSEGSVVNSMVLSGNGRYVIDSRSATATFQVRDGLREYSNNFPHQYDFSRTGLSIIPAVNTFVYDGTTQYIIAFAAGGTAGYRYASDGQTETAITVSGATLTGVQRIGYSRSLGYVYIQDGANKAATSVLRFTFAGSTLTYVDTITLSAAPANVGHNTMWIGNTYLCICDDAGVSSTASKTFQRYGRASGTATTSKNWQMSGNMFSGFLVRPDDNALFMICLNDTSLNTTSLGFKLLLE